MDMSRTKPMVSKNALGGSLVAASRLNLGRLRLPHFLFQRFKRTPEAVALPSFMEPDYRRPDLKCQVTVEHNNGDIDTKEVLLGSETFARGLKASAQLALLKQHDMRAVKILYIIFKEL